jgi:Cell division septal protein
MSASYETAQQRFFRPADVARIRRNQRRIQVLRMLRLCGRMIVAAGLIAGALSLYHHTQSDSRFAVKSIEVIGAVHTPRSSIDAITRRYLGTNLFKIDIAGLQNELRGLGWVARIEAEKTCPTLCASVSSSAFRSPSSVEGTDSPISTTTASPSPTFLHRWATRTCRSSRGRGMES